MSEAAGDGETETVPTALGQIPSFQGPLPITTPTGTQDLAGFLEMPLQLFPFRTPPLFHPSIEPELHLSDLICNVGSLVQL